MLDEILKAECHPFSIEEFYYAARGFICLNTRSGLRGSSKNKKEIFTDTAVFTFIRSAEVTPTEMTILSRFLYVDFYFFYLICLF